jgi:hypothetical protein
MAHCKGLAVTSRLRWVEQHHGAGGLEKVKAQLTPEHQQLIAQHILPHAWVPMTLFIELNVVADRLFGNGDLALCQTMGAWAAEATLPKVFKLFYRLGSPMFIFERAAKLWSAHYDTGSLTPSRDAAGVVHLLIRDVENPHRAHCLSVLGWAAKSIELSGSKLTLSTEARCRTRGDPECEIQLAWQ